MRQIFGLKIFAVMRNVESDWFANNMEESGDQCKVVFSGLLLGSAGNTRRVKEGGEGDAPPPLTHRLDLLSRWYS